MLRFPAAVLLVGALFVVGCADDPTHAGPGKPNYGGIIRGGGNDDAGNSGSTGSLWPPTLWNFLPGSARGDVSGTPPTPDACITSGFCFLGALTQTLGTLSVPTNPDPNPDPIGRSEERRVGKECIAVCR